MKKTQATRKKRERAAKVADLTSLKSIALMELATARRLRADAESLPEALEVRISAEANQHESSIEVFFGLELQARYEDTPKETPRDELPLFVAARYRLHYEVADSHVKLSKADIEAFAEQTSLYNVWPYWRELLTSLTSRMAIPPLSVPLLSSVKIKKQTGAKRTTRRKGKSNLR